MDFGTLGGFLAVAALAFFGLAVYLALALKDERRARRTEREQARAQIRELRVRLADEPDLVWPTTPPRVF